MLRRRSEVTRDHRNGSFSFPTARADLTDWFKGHDRPPAPAGKALTFNKPAEWQSSLALTPEDKVTGYNNFYEFGLDKADPRPMPAACVPIPGPHDWRRSGQTADARSRRPDPALSAGRAYLPDALRGGPVNGGALGRLPAT